VSGSDRTPPHDLWILASRRRGESRRVPQLEYLSLRDVHGDEALPILRGLCEVLRGLGEVSRGLGEVSARSCTFRTSIPYMDLSWNGIGAEGARLLREAAPSHCDDFQTLMSVVSVRGTGTRHTHTSCWYSSHNLYSSPKEGWHKRNPPSSSFGLGINEIFPPPPTDRMPNLRPPPPLP